MTPRQLAAVVRRMGPYRRSHHPLCGPFRADVLVVHGKRYCIACYVGYPVLALTVVAGLLLVPQVAAPWWAWILSGLIAALPQTLSFMGRVPDWRAQIAVKAALGLGFGLVIVGDLSVPVAWPWRLGLLLVTLSGLNLLWLFRFHRLERTCVACPQNALRPRCEGLRELDDRVGHLVRLPGSADLGWQRVG